jgi:hypothetical protein
MNDMTKVITPKSDQINADDLLSGPITITITDVQVKPGQEQPVSMFFEGSDKAYRPCKSMARVLVAVWGADASKYKGRSLTLYCDPKVKWGGMEVGGLRISHMSHIDSAITMALTVTRANKKPFTVKPIQSTNAAATQSPGSASAGTSGTSADLATSASSAAPDTITADEALALETRCTENGIDPARLRKAAKVERLSMILAADHAKAKAWIDSAISKAAVTT